MASLNTSTIGHRSKYHSKVGQFLIFRRGKLSRKNISNLRGFPNTSTKIRSQIAAFSWTIHSFNAWFCFKSWSFIGRDFICLWCSRYIYINPCKKQHNKKIFNTSIKRRDSKCTSINRHFTNSNIYKPGFFIRTIYFYRKYNFYSDLVGNYNFLF